MHFPDQPDAEGAARNFLGRPVVLICNHCARVQDGLVVAASEEEWTNQATYMTARGFSPDKVWWYHTICQACERCL